LLHGDDKWLAENIRHAAVAEEAIVGGVSSREEEEELVAVNAWVRELGLKEGELAYDHADPVTGDQVAVFDLAWPNGLQEGLTEPVALLLNEGERTIALANAAGLRCFTSSEAFRRYVTEEVIGASPPDLIRSTAAASAGL
jgi:hypothetical protein